MAVRSESNSSGCGWLSQVRMVGRWIGGQRELRGIKEVGEEDRLEM